ncbi:hypothetical protein A0257_22700 (plasmid) [Hymenobacter psoromatis]|nr:hypothetical protein A0257_22700 [Hymenobacter psoromatis]
MATFLASNLRALRRRANLSQSDVADELGTDYNTISRYENGKSTPKLEALSKLARVFAVGIEQLRDQDLSLPAEGRAAAGAPPALPGPAVSVRPARHPLLVSVELDGTAASLHRAVSRLTAINQLVAEIE